MNKKKLQQQAVSLAFKRSEKDDWEVIATEQHEENIKLQEKIKNFELNNSDIVEIDPKKCINWKYSDRNVFEMGDIEDLAEDIKMNGLLQPVIARKISNSLDYDYEIIAGERRWRACHLANINLKAILTDKDDAECLVIQTSENKKKSLSPYSLAKVYVRLMNDLGISQNDLAKKLNIPKSSFGELMSFNKVPDIIWATVSDMSKVKIKTASYIATSCNNGDDYINAFIEYANNIKDGIGADNLEKLIKKHFNDVKAIKSSSVSYENKEGVFLFRITGKERISFSKSILKKIEIDSIAQNLVSFLDKYV
ncbi:MAG: ParB/RepB/Spo0J family partition protein [Silvanigrellaceae bacterium]|nr:ParB/RepB/Spo0J family partition protein [Silvanigrellaceae bacterium]